MSQELLRIVENIARDKNIDKESIFRDLEEAMISAVRKHFGDHRKTKLFPPLAGGANLLMRNLYQNILPV